MRQKSLQNKILAALLLAVGMVLPLLTAQIKEIGDSLLPMHLPVLLCGLLCGAKYGTAVGLILPFLRAITFGMPPVYPNAVWMATELATYGLVIGLLYHLICQKNVIGVYMALIPAMLAGRIVWGISKAILLYATEKSFTLWLFWVGGFLDAVPGILLQLILIPVIMSLVHRIEGQKPYGGSNRNHKGE